MSAGKMTKAELVEVILRHEKTIEILEAKYEASELKLYATELREEAERDKSRQILIDYIDELPNAKEIIESQRIEIAHLQQYNHSDEISLLRKENEMLKNKIINLV